MPTVTSFVAAGGIAIVVLSSVSFWSFRQSDEGLVAEIPGLAPEPPPSKPFHPAVVASGGVEALSDNVAIGVPVAGLVQEVFVTVNDRVNTGTQLFSLDDRDLRADLSTAAARLAVARAELEVEDAALAKHEAQLIRYEAAGARVVGAIEVETRRADLAIRRARCKASELEIAAGEAEIARLNQRIERLTVRSPRDGTVLQVNVRVGEFAATAPANPLMIVGDTNRLQVRVDVDEQNATHIREGQAAVAFVKGAPDFGIPLHFVRIEPFVVPKSNLDGNPMQRVDTRVLQVVYSLSKPDHTPIYVGQQVDVFIQAP